jgi:LPS sulfotransferase NodH
MTMIPVPQGRSERGYVICSEQRSGSTLLCQWLSSTGTLGYPREYFKTVEHAIALERDPSLIRNVLERATTSNGVYGIKLFPYQFDATMKARWLGQLPRRHFIHLERRDLLGQAISLVRALQTTQYHSYQQPRVIPRYDAHAISRQLARLAEAHGRWRRYFARNGLDVLWLVYEDMVREPDTVMRAIAAHIGVTAPPAIDSGLIRVAIQRDALSDDWRARFMADTGTLDILDHPLGQARVRVRRVVRNLGYWSSRGSALFSGRKP